MPKDNFVRDPLTDAQRLFMEAAAQLTVQARQGAGNHKAGVKLETARTYVKNLVRYNLHAPSSSGPLHARGFESLDWAITMWPDMLLLQNVPEGASASLRVKYLQRAANAYSQLSAVLQGQLLRTDLPKAARLSQLQQDAYQAFRDVSDTLEHFRNTTTESLVSEKELANMLSREEMAEVVAFHKAQAICTADVVAAQKYAAAALWFGKTAPLRQQEWVAKARWLHVEPAPAGENTYDESSRRLICHASKTSRRSKDGQVFEIDEEGVDALEKLLSLTRGRLRVGPTVPVDVFTKFPTGGRGRSVEVPRAFKAQEIGNLVRDAVKDVFPDKRAGVSIVRKSQLTDAYYNVEHSEDASPAEIVRAAVSRTLSNVRTLPKQFANTAAAQATYYVKDIMAARAERVERAERAERAARAPRIKYPWEMTDEEEEEAAAAAAEAAAEAAAQETQTPLLGRRKREPSYEEAMSPRKKPRSHWLAPNSDEDDVPRPRRRLDLSLSPMSDGDDDGDGAEIDTRAVMRAVAPGGEGMVMDDDDDDVIDLVSSDEEDDVPVTRRMGQLSLLHARMRRPLPSSSTFLALSVDVVTALGQPHPRPPWGNGPLDPLSLARRRDTQFGDF